MDRYLNLIDDFKGMLWLALLPGLVAAGSLALAVAESARDRKEGGRKKKKKGKDDERRN